jgi:hypothetical protein
MLLDIFWAPGALPISGHFRPTSFQITRTRLLQPEHLAKAYFLKTDDGSFRAEQDPPFVDTFAATIFVTDVDNDERAASSSVASPPDTRSQLAENSDDAALAGSTTAAGKGIAGGTIGARTVTPTAVRSQLVADGGTAVIHGGSRNQRRIRRRQRPRHSGRPVAPDGSDRFRQTILAEHDQPGLRPV